MFINGSILYHSRSIQRSLARVGASATVDFDRFALHVWGRKRYFQFTPQFIRKENGKMRFSIRIPDDPRGFVGWLPYFNKQWPAAIDKLQFKQHCLANGLRCPAYSSAGTDFLPGFLIKPRRSSLGVGIRGPFAKFDPLNAAHALREGEYYDQFIPGKVGKAWYWNDAIVCCELRAMPEITGDGAQSIRHFIEAHLAKYGFTPEWEDFTDTLAFYGASPEHVPAKGEHVVADFRFGSMLVSPDWKNHNVVAEHRASKVGGQLKAAGPVFWGGIPEDIRRFTLYTVDFVVDSEDRVWFLEMNCNPGVHPDVYPYIFDDLFESPLDERSVVPEADPAILQRQAAADPTAFRATLPAQPRSPAGSSSPSRAPSVFPPPP